VSVPKLRKFRVNSTAYTFNAAALKSMLWIFVKLFSLQKQSESMLKVNPKLMGIKHWQKIQLPQLNTLYLILMCMRVCVYIYRYIIHMYVLRHG